MRFSIIIPCYNVQQYIRQCVDSVLTQTFEDYEVILVDDGSPDECPAICDEYGKKHDKVKVIHKPNGGLSDARNAGLDVAQGDYVIFIDSDDWWDDKDALCKIDDRINESGADVIIIGMKKYFTHDKQYGDIRVPQKCYESISTLSYAKQIEHYMRRNIFVACACDKVVRRALIERDNQRFVNNQLSEDVEWCCKLLMKEPQIDVIEETFYVYRQQVSTSISANIGAKNIHCILDVINRYVDSPVSKPILHYIANQYVLLITNIMRLSINERKPFDDKVRELWWLVDNNWYPYVRIVSKVKFLGYDIIKKMLRIYYLKKTKR